MAIDWEAYAKGVEAQIAQLKGYVEQLEAGKFTLGERTGDGPWRDITQEAISRNKTAIATYETILNDVLSNRIKSGPS